MHWIAMRSARVGARQVRRHCFKVRASLCSPLPVTHRFASRGRAQLLTFLDAELDARNPGASDLLRDHNVSVEDAAYKVLAPCVPIVPPAPADERVVRPRRRIAALTTKLLRTLTRTH